MRGSGCYFYCGFPERFPSQHPVTRVACLIVTEQRTPSKLDRACDTYVHNLAKLSPLSATAWGIHGRDGDIEKLLT